MYTVVDPELGELRFVETLAEAELLHPGAQPTVDIEGHAVGANTGGVSFIPWAIEPSFGSVICPRCLHD